MKSCTCAVAALLVVGAIIFQEARQGQAADTADLYALRLLLAKQAWEAQHLDRVEQLLDQCPPALRRWEWHYLKQQCHTDQLTVKGHGRCRSAVFSPVGHQLAWGDGPAVQIADANNGRAVATLTGHT